MVLIGAMPRAGWLGPTSGKQPRRSVNTLSKDSRRSQKESSTPTGQWTTENDRIAWRTAAQ
eukprot:3263753-Alexandrium_andersonii.AAC.1